MKLPVIKGKQFTPQSPSIVKVQALPYDVLHVLVCEVCGIELERNEKRKLFPKKCPKCHNTGRKILSLEQFKNYLQGRALEAIRMYFLVDVNDLSWNIERLKEAQEETKLWQETLSRKQEPPASLNDKVNAPKKTKKKTA